MLSFLAGSLHKRYKKVLEKERDARTASTKSSVADWLSQTDFITGGFGNSSASSDSGAPVKIHQRQQPQSRIRTTNAARAPIYAVEIINGTDGHPWCMQSLGRAKVAWHLSRDGRFYDGWSFYYHDYDNSLVHETRFLPEYVDRPFTKGSATEQERKEQTKKRSFLKRQQRSRQASRMYTEDPDAAKNPTRKRGHWVRRKRPRR